MSSRNFRELLEERWSHDYFVCVGLDTDRSKISKVVERYLVGSASKDHCDLILAFNLAIVNATGELVCAYKLNSAFYEQYGTGGMEVLSETISYIHRYVPDVPVIFDAKRGDIGNTNKGYVQAAFDLFDADAVTVHPYLGKESLEPFLLQNDKGIIVLCRTSNLGAGEFQDLKIDGEPLYQVVARRVSNEWNTAGNCALVVGATCPKELRKVRSLVGDLPILIPGIGAQGGNVKATVKAGKDSHGKGMIINSSRGIIFASTDNDFADAALRATETLHNLINYYRRESL